MKRLATAIAFASTACGARSLPRDPVDAEVAPEPAPDAPLARDAGVSPDQGADAALPACAPFSADSPWCANLLVSAEPSWADTRAEPALSVDASGRAVAAWISGTPEQLSIRAASSADGFTDSEPVSAEGPYLFAFDPALASVGKRTYVVYLDVTYGAGGSLESTIWLRHTEDAETWSDPRVVNDTVGFHDRPWVSIAPDGAVWVGWAAGDGVEEVFGNRVAWSYDQGDTFAYGATLVPPSNDVGYFPPESPLSFLPDGAIAWSFAAVAEAGAGLVVRPIAARSTDGGASFATTAVEEIAVPDAEVPDYDDPQAVRAFAFGYQTSGAAAASRFYVAYAQPAGAWWRDLVVRASEDGGQTFGAAVTVNAVSGTVSHGLPIFWPAGDEAGGAHIAWYDRRDGAWAVYSSSTADGSAWSANMRVSDATFDSDEWSVELEADMARWPGHFFGLAVRDGYLHAVWGDLRSGESDIYYAQTAYAVY